MSPTGGVIAPAVGGVLPADRDALLQRSLRERQKLFQLVRQILDELDEAAPWDQLYYPPDAPEAFLGMAAGLLGVVDRIPGRIRELVGLLSLASPDDETRQTLEEAEFYYAGIHNMCSHDLGRLRALLAPHEAPTAPPLTPADRNFLCEVAADLKGKYSSALMGATASIVAEGSWSGVDVEPVLFPEKAEEFRRNGELVCSLRRTLEAIAELRRQVPFAELLERWRAGARVDPYALADLATFRGILGQLLKRNLRRAFYSGDYHQIQRREAALAATIAALEATHHRTWEEAADAGAATAYRQLQDLTLRTVAILDLELLEQLLGSRAIKDLRAAVVVERAAERNGKPASRRPLPAELEALLPLVAREDLRSFLELLLGSVMKRASVVAVTRLVSAVERGAEAAAPEPVEDLLPSIAIEEPPPLQGVAPSPEIAAATPPPPAPTPPPPAPAPSASAPPAPPPSSVAPGSREPVEQLHDMLVALQSADNPHWSSFRMLQRLVGRHTRIPPSMVQGAHPFVYEVLNNLVPQLEAAAALGAVPQEARKRLVECCLALSDDHLTPDQMTVEVPANLARLHRLLEGLTAATAAQLRG